MTALSRVAERLTTTTVSRRYSGRTINPENSRPSSSSAAHAIVVTSAIVFLVVTLDHLSVFPAVGEDEPWIAAAPYKLAVQGVYGSDLFAGYYGSERHNYQHMPLYPLLEAGIFKIAGVGVVQMRLLSVLCGLALIGVVFLVGSEIRDARVGAAAVVLMLVWRIAVYGDATGILLLDRARINRYDIAVPVFGLLAFWTFLRAQRTGESRIYLLSGLLAALASLSHLFGAFWLPILLALSLRRSPGYLRRTGAGMILLGFLLPWLPCVAYIASGWNDFLGQTRFVAPRFDLLSPSFYISNALHGEGPISIDWLKKAVGELWWNQPGAWIAIASLPAAAVVMAREGVHHGRRAAPATMLLVVAVAQFVMFLALLKVKTISYMIGIWPLAVLMSAWFAVWLWDRGKTPTRTALFVLFVVIAIEGATRVGHAAVAARRVIPYDWYTGEVASCIPAGSRVLGLQHYWLGLRQYEYRTWLVPAIYANPLYRQPPVPLAVSLEQIDPDIILIDRYMSGFFDAATRVDHPMHSTQVQFEAFLASRRAEPMCAIRDPTYGTMKVYGLQRGER